MTAGIHLVCREMTRHYIPERKRLTAMCLIVYKPEGRKFDRSIITNAMFTNGDGWGLMWVEKGKIKTLKSVDMDSLFSTLDKLKEDSTAMSLHLRQATHGPIIKDNCHPFVSPCKEFAMMHNGVISYTKMEGTESDTRAFCRETAWPLMTALGYEAAHDAIDLADKSGSRLIFVNRAGRFLCTGKWHERDGLRYSNSYSFVTYKPLSYKPLGYSTFSAFEPCDFAEMGDMTHRGILELCRRDPDYVAQLITDFFGTLHDEAFTDYEPEYTDEPIDVDAF